MISSIQPNLYYGINLKTFIKTNHIKLHAFDKFERHKKLPVGRKPVHVVADSTPGWKPERYFPAGKNPCGVKRQSSFRTFF